MLELSKKDKKFIDKILKRGHDKIKIGQVFLAYAKKHEPECVLCAYYLVWLMVGYAGIDKESNGS